MSANVVEGEAACRIEYAKWICPTKRAFKSLAEAKAAAVKALGNQHDLPALYAYRCDACHLLHLTKKKRRKWVAATQVVKQ